MITHRPCLDVAVLHALTRESRNHLGERTTRERGGATHPRRMARMGCVSTAKEGTAVVTCALRVARGGIRDAPRGQVGSRPLQLVALADRARVRHVLRAARPSGVLVAISLAWRCGARWEECSRRARRNARPPPSSHPTLFAALRPRPTTSPRVTDRPSVSGSTGRRVWFVVLVRAGGGARSLWRRRSALELHVARRIRHRPLARRVGRQGARPHAHRQHDRVQGARSSQTTRPLRSSESTNQSSDGAHAEEEAEVADPTQKTAAVEFSTERNLGRLSPTDCRRTPPGRRVALRHDGRDVRDGLGRRDGVAQLRRALLARLARPTWRCGYSLLVVVVAYDRRAASGTRRILPFEPCFGVFLGEPEYSTDMFARRAADVAAEYGDGGASAGTPLFLFLAFNAVHATVSTPNGCARRARAAPWRVCRG